MARTTIRRNLLATTIIAGSLAASPVMAQGTPAADAAADDSTIVVTGSLITNPNLVRSSPVNVTTSDEIELKQVNVAEQILREIPGIVPNVGSAVNNGNGGASFVDLRGLGANRNIVLLDGKRITPARLQGEVDLNNIPVALVDRVDVTTGGAVTTYGADAITGVVNFITKRDFAGFEFQVSDQITEKGDGNFLRTDLTVGANFDDGRGNAVLSIGYQESDPVYQGDRDFSNTNYDSFTGTASGSGTTVPATFTRVVPANTVAGQGPTTRRQINPVTGVAGGVTLFNFNPYNIFQTPFRRYNMFAQARYEISDAVEVYTRALFSKNTVKTIIAPSGVFSSDVLINLNNPYLPAGLRNQFCSVGNIFLAGQNPITTTGLTPQGVLSTAQCNAAAAATGPSDPNYRTVQTNLRRRTVEVGPRISDYTTQVFDFRVGFRGAISDHINWDVNASYGESDRPQTLQNYILTSRVRQALLADNATTCTTNSNSCVPLNVFGAQGTITPAMIPFITGESVTIVRTSLAQAAATVNGDLGFTIPSAADPISFAVGGEYRKYSAQQKSDLLSQTPGELGGAGGAAPNIDGGYDVYEALGELVAPLVQDKPGFKSLTLEAGIRYSKYKINPSNNGYDATTYKVGGSWEPLDGLKLRGNYSRAVRAPNINELYAPRNTGLTNLSRDPCGGARPVGNANLTAVCLAQGAPAASIGTIANPTAGQANSTTLGSVNLKPEKADTFTIGAVIQPLRGLSASIDYYNVLINSAITAPTPQDAIAACFGSITAASATDPNCTVIRRSPSTGALDGDPSNTGGLFQPTTNSGRLFTSGIDLSVNYRTNLTDEIKLALAFNGNYTISSKFRSVPLGINRECVGFYSVNCSFTGSIQPKFQWTQRSTLTFGQVDVSLLWRHVDKMRQEPLDISSIVGGVELGNGPGFVGTLGAGRGGGDLNGQTVNFGRIRAYDYFDLSTRIAITDSINLTITVQNLTNQKPPVIGSTIGSTSFNSGNTYPSTYDALGRKYGASVRLKF
jgi:iron complex outermembrane recepter protein